MTNLVLDTGVLGQLCHPKALHNQNVSLWAIQILSDPQQRFQLYIPEIADYELRRKLIHLANKNNQTRSNSIIKLDTFLKQLKYIPLSTHIMHRAAHLWAEAKAKGLSTASPDSLDGDVILAAQAIEVNGAVITTNQKHLKQYVQAISWESIQVP